MQLHYTARSGQPRDHDCQLSAGSSPHLKHTLISAEVRLDDRCRQGALQAEICAIQHWRESMLEDVADQRVRAAVVFSAYLSAHSKLARLTDGQLHDASQVACEIEFALGLACL